MHYKEQEKTRVAADLRSLLNAAADDFKDKDYLRYKRRGDIESISFASFRKAVNSVGTALFEAGLNGKTIGIIGETSPEWITTYYAAVTSGCIVVPLDKELSHKEIAAFIEKSRASAVFFSPSFRKMFEEFSDQLEGVYNFVEFSDVNYAEIFSSVNEKAAAYGNEETSASDGESNTDASIEESTEEVSSTSDEAQEVSEEDCCMQEAVIEDDINPAVCEEFKDNIFESRFIGFESVLLLGKKLLENGDERYLSFEGDLEKTCAILFTSGTTGTSKGVMISHKNLITAVNSSYLMTSFRENDVIVSVLPIHHTYEMTCGILTPLSFGATVCINDSLKYVLKNFQLFKPTGLVLVPLFVATMHKKIWDTATKSGKAKKLRAAISVSDRTRKIGIDLRKILFKEVIDAFGGRLRLIISGGAALSAELVNCFDQLGITICQGYGITECAPLISVCPYKANKPGSVGLPVPGLEVIIDKENPDDPAGEIVVRGDNVMQGYYMDEDATAAVLEDGWFHTGDYGYVDDDGYVYITGRKKNVIVLNNGKNVFPEEIESYIEKIDLVSEVVVVGRDDENGQTFGITALIYPDLKAAKDAGLEDINDISEAIKTEIAHLNKTLPSFKQIRGIEIRKNEFDKTTSHKIKRHSL